MMPTARGCTLPLSVAPMMDRTDRHCRYFLRLLTRRTLLYTVMVTARAIEHGSLAALLDYDESEHPVALQLGGSDPARLARSAKIGEDFGYDEININIGCPSDRVQSGRFGACLMREPDLVAECVAQMRAAVSIPVTVKHRIGVDDLDRYEDMARFVEIVSAAGADRFTVHARKAWLQGLSPKANRTIPPIRHADVHRLKADFPHLSIELNGHIKTLDEALEHLQHVDAVMIGRAAWDDPYLFAHADRRIFGDTAPAPTRQQVVEAMKPYFADQLARGTSPHLVLRPMMSLFSGQPGTRRWKRTLTERAHDGPAALDAALAAVAEVAATVA